MNPTEELLDALDLYIDLKVEAILEDFFPHRLTEAKHRLMEKLLEWKNDGKV